MAFIDELLSGFVSVATPVVRDDLQLSYTQVGLLLTVPMVISTLLEPPILGWSDGVSKRRLAPLGLAALGLAWLAAAASPGFLALLVTLSLLWVAGVSVGLTQAWLVDLRPAREHATLAAWTFCGALGDLFAPLLVAAMVAAGAGWRSMFLTAAGVWIVVALGVWRWRPPAPTPTESDAANKSDEPTPGWLGRLRAALRRPRLLRWALLLELADPLDETLVVFAVLHLHDTLGLSEAAAAVIVGVYTVGQLALLPTLPRLLGRVGPIALLRGSALVAAAALAALAAAPSAGLASACLLLAGMGAACLYPLMQGEAYRSLPGQSGAVLAVQHVAAPLGLAVPWLLGLAASRWGLPTAIAIIAIAPALVALLVPAGRDGWIGRRWIDRPRRGISRPRRRARTRRTR